VLPWRGFEIDDRPVTAPRPRGHVIELLRVPRRALIAQSHEGTLMSRKLCLIHTASLRATLVLVSLCLAAAVANAEDSEKKEKKTVVEAGSTVGIEYTLTLEDGTKVDSNVGGEALRFEQGSGQIIPGLDKELIGMEIAEAKQVKVAPDQGYGQVDPAAFTEVPVSELPEDARVPGMMLVAQDDQGNARRLRVHKIEGDKATLDFNHPLAGETLVFDVKILQVQ
jgi:FKBP-type peptidyl-prolyl cis-trans isomerase 2